MAFSALTRHWLPALILLGLLGACGEGPGVTVNPTPRPTLVPTSTATSELPCLDIKSKELSLGPSLGKNLCLEGSIILIETIENGKAGSIALDTRTGLTGNTLYKICVYIPDIASFGQENIDKLYKGLRVRVRGTFINNLPGDYCLKVSRPEQVEMLL